MFSETDRPHSPAPPTRVRWAHTPHRPSRDCILHLPEWPTPSCILLKYNAPCCVALFIFVIYSDLCNYVIHALPSLPVVPSLSGTVDQFCGIFSWTGAWGNVFSARPSGVPRGPAPERTGSPGRGLSPQPCDGTSCWDVSYCFSLLWTEGTCHSGLSVLAMQLKMALLS